MGTKIIYQLPDGSTVLSDLDRFHDEDKTIVRVPHVGDIVGPGVGENVPLGALYTVTRVSEARDVDYNVEFVVEVELK